jgi:hypothetical protein
MSSILDVDCELMRLFHLNHSTEEPWYTIYTCLYVSFTLASFASNALLLLALYMNNKKRRGGLNNPNRILLRPTRSSDKTRDFLVAHLATFDLFISFTMPFTALDALSKYWPMGPDTEIICRLVKSIPSTAVYSSSMIVVTIAIHCCRQIICHSGRQLSPANLRYITPAILVISLLMSSPVFYYAKLYYIIAPSPQNNYSSVTLAVQNDTDFLHISPSFNLSSFPVIENLNGSNDFPALLSNLSSSMSKLKETTSGCNEDEWFDTKDWLDVIYCIEDWPFESGLAEQGYPMDRLYYSLFSLFFQLIIPGIIISVSYFLIYRKLRNQSIARERMLGGNRNTERIEREHARSKRRNKMLAIMSLLFLISWLPLSIIGTLLDSKPDILGKDIGVVTLVFMTCHLIGMSSAFVNPIIYGYSNKHIRSGNYSMLYSYYSNNSNFILG